MSDDSWIVRDSAGLGLIERLPPVVVSCSLPFGSVSVPAGPCRLEIAFSEPMITDSWSIVAYARDSLPVIEGVPHFSDDGHVMSLEMLLDSGHLYAFWLNTVQHDNFRDIQGKALVPYLIGFATR